MHTTQQYFQKALQLTNACHDKVELFHLLADGGKIPPYGMEKFHHVGGDFFTCLQMVENSTK